MFRSPGRSRPSVTSRGVHDTRPTVLPVDRPDTGAVTATVTATDLISAAQLGRTER